MIRAVYVLKTLNMSTDGSQCLMNRCFIYNLSTSFLKNLVKTYEAVITFICSTTNEKSKKKNGNEHRKGCFSGIK